METATIENTQVGDFLAYTLVTDTQVVEVIAKTAKTIKVRRTRSGDVLKSNNAPLPVVWTEALSDDREGVQVKTYRERKNGTFRVDVSYGTLYHAPTVGGKPVTRTDYSF